LNIALYFFQISGAGGAERMICRLANAFVKQGQSVCVISMDALEDESYYTLDANVSWVKLGYEQGLKDKIRRTHKISRSLKENKIDALVGFVMSSDKTVYTAAKLAGVKLIVSERNAPAMYRLRYGRFTRYITYSLLHLADRITVQFPDYIGQYPKTLRARMTAISNPVDPAQLKARPDQANERGRFTLLAVGRLEPVQKRMMILVEAFFKVASKHPEWDLCMVGDGPEQSALMNRIQDLGLQKRCSMEPAQKEIFDQYSNAQLFVMPSLWEGFPNSLAEAMAHGLPAVGFNGAPGVQHLINESGGGWLASDNGDVDALAQSLDAAMRDNSLRAERGEKARVGMQAYAPQKQIADWLALIKDVVSGKP
jgi:GalNAc-alpha-(1->4)-GalNAc-alpha-(1->3)-diNAcBac-PP-undecaprenol alpha-1,4-N-acetyl-D-galactosaminyltransferase